MRRSKLATHKWSSGCSSVTEASCLEIVDEEYIAELKEKIENENTKNSTEERFQKVGE